MRGKRKSVNLRSSTSPRRKKANEVSTSTRLSYRRRSKPLSVSTKIKLRRWSWRWWTLRLASIREFKNLNSRSPTSEKTTKLLMLWKLLTLRSWLHTSRNTIRSTMSSWQRSSTVRMPWEPNLSWRRKLWSKNGRSSWMILWKQPELKNRLWQRIN